MATPVSNSVPLLTATNNNNGTLTDEFISGLLQGSSWTFGGGPRVITYSLTLNDYIEVGAPGGPAPGPGDLWAENTAFAAAISQAFEAWANVANINFQLTGTSDADFYFESSADIAVTLTGNQLGTLFPSLLALGIFPSPDFFNGIDRDGYPNPEGDIFFDNDQSVFTLLSEGGSGLAILLHEIGHALGLKHIFDDGDNSRPTFDSLGISEYGSLQYTIMGDGLYSGSVGVHGHPSTPMPLDILAIQQIYGANTSHRTGDDTYVFGNDGEVVTIWDAGGTDTFDFSGLFTDSVIDLREGHFSHFGTIYGPLETLGAAVAYGTVIENAVSGSGDDTINGNAFDNQLTGNGGHDVIFGHAGNDLLLGGNENDFLDGGTGADFMSGGSGNDHFEVDNINDVVSEVPEYSDDSVNSPVTFGLGDHVEKLYLTGSSDIDGTGNAWTNAIFGNSGNNRLNGKGGFDQLSGGNGNDVYVIEEVDVVASTFLYMDGDPGDFITNGNVYYHDTASPGTLTVYATDANHDGLVDIVSLSYIELAYTELSHYVAGNWNLALSTAATDQGLTTGTYANAMRQGFEAPGRYGMEISGNGAASNTLSGGFEVLAAKFDYSASTPQIVEFEAIFEQRSEGAPQALHGRIRINRPSTDLVVEEVDGGIDRVISGISYELPANVEELQLSGSNAINGSGNELSNWIEGNNAANVLNGKTGTDIMAGLAGNDTYMVDQAGDQVIEALNAGSDFVRSTVSWTLSANVEELQLLGSNPTNGTGNGLNNWIQGNAAANILNGLAGADAMIGLGGNDTYFVDHAGDKTVEALNAGSDFVRSTISWTLMAHTEELQLLGSDPINGTGNELNNWIQGNSAANVLDGKAGADAMIGLGGNDTYFVDHAGDKTIEAADGGSDFVRSAISWALMAHTEELQLLGVAAINGTGNELNNWIQGNSAANVLDGKAGADAMIGLGGNDTYFVDHAGDKTIEAASAGVDFVRATIGWTLMAHTEELQLLGSNPINGTGNELNNWIQGNSAANVLDGKAGADAMIGLGGNDTYFVDHAGDKTIEAASAGVDFVRATISWTLMAHTEELQLLGVAAINGTGNELNNWIMGNSAANILDGKAGNDSLITGGGADIVRFSTALGPANIDRINDFSVADDTIQLAASIFTNLAPGALGANAFLSGAGITSAADSDDRILYNTSNGFLYYDADGLDGAAAQQFAVLTGLPALTAADFMVTLA